MNTLDPSLSNSRKPFLKRFWVLGVGIGTAVLVLGGGFVLSRFISGGDGTNTKPFGSIFPDLSDDRELNPRIEASFLPESGAAFKYNSPLVYEGHLYLGTSERTGYDNALVTEIHDNYFYKMDLDLNVIWEYPLGKRMVKGGATIDSNENLYFVTDLVTDNPNFVMGPKGDKEQQYLSELKLVSLTREGELRWEVPISGENNYWNRGMIAPAISADDIIYAGNRQFYAFDSEGNQVGQFPGGDQEIRGYGGAPVIDGDGYVFFTAPEPMLLSQEWQSEVIKAYKFSPRLESLVWSTEMGNELMDNEGGNPDGGGGQRARAVESTPALGLGGRSLYGITGCTISKIDTASGELLWSIKPEGATGHINASPAIDDSDNLYVGTKSNTESAFYAISADGEVLWRTLIGADLYNSPILGDDETVYVGSETQVDGKFHALDMTTGEQKWAIGKDNEQKIPDFSFGSMALYEGYVYVGVHSATEGNQSGESDQTLFKIKIDADEYLPKAAWPRIHGGNLNLGRRE